MSAKITYARRAAFLKALGETGNVTVSAERAKVSRSWVLKQRKGDPGFGAECREALRRARDRLRMSGECNAPRGWGHLDGVELVVRGSNGRRVQIARARVGQIGPADEERFLGALSRTCNVKAALAEAGFSKGAMYTHRKRWQAFADKWDAAIKEAYARIEIGLLENACNLFSASELPPEMPMRPMSVEQAIHLLHMHKHKVLGIGKAPGQWWRRPRTVGEMRASILRKIEAIRNARSLSKEDKERDRREWARRRGSGQVPSPGSG